LFSESRTQFDELENVFAEDPTLEYAALDFTSTSGVCVRHRSDNRIGKHCSDSTTVDTDRLKSLLALTSASLMWRIEDGLLFFLGSDDRNDQQFNVAIIRRFPGAPSSPECLDEPPRESPGSCSFELDDRWELTYDWVAHSVSPSN
jgi:hypothetical protein